jgi:hypothetical protein
MKRYLFSLLLLSVIVELFYFYSVPIGFEGDAGGYYRIAKIFATNPPSDYIKQLPPYNFLNWRPPGFPFYLHLTGVTWADRFTGWEVANAIMAISLPPLLFGALLPIGCRWAFAAGLVYIFSTLPFTYAKVMLTEHPYSFFLVLMAFLYSRFYATRKPPYMVAAMVAGFLAAMFRYEGLYVMAFAALMAFGVEVYAKRWGSVKAACVTGLLILVSLTAWSWERSRMLDDPRYFGSLHNFTGRQLFADLLAAAGGAAASYSFTRPPDDATDRWTPDHRRVIFISPENGPASTEIGTLSNCCAGTYPDYYVDPSVDLGWTMEAMVVDLKGPVGGDQFLRQIVREAIVAHPEILLLYAAQGIENLGIEIRKPGLSKFGGVWNYDSSMALDFNLAGIAKDQLTKPLWEAYEESSRCGDQGGPLAGGRRLPEVGGRRRIHA